MLDINLEEHKTSDKKRNKEDGNKLNKKGAKTQSSSKFNPLNRLKNKDKKAALSKEAEPADDRLCL